MSVLTFNSAPFNAIAFNGSIASGSGLVPDFRQSVVYALNQIAALTAIVGSRIYWSRPSQRAIYPNVCLAISSSDRVKNLSGAGGVCTSTVDITIQSNLPGAEAALTAAAKAIYDVLDGFRGHQNGIAWLSCYYDDESDDSSDPVDASDRFVHARIVPYRIRYREPLPALVTQTNV